RHLDAKHGWLERAGFARWVAMGHLRAGRKVEALRVYLRSAVRDRDVGNAIRAGAALIGERAFDARRRYAADKPDLPWLRLYLDRASSAEDGSDRTGVLGVEAPLEQDQRADEEQHPDDDRGTERPA